MKEEVHVNYVISGVSRRGKRDKQMKTEEIGRLQKRKRMGGGEEGGKKNRLGKTTK
jgi:hypothetical protein